MPDQLPPWDYNCADLVRQIVRNCPVVEEAVKLLESLHMYMEQGFLEEFQAKLKPGVFNNYLRRMEAVIKELK